jgi:FkbM family methyltransferase
MWHAYTRLAERNASFVAVDGGAHKGFHTKRLAAIPNCRKVFAIEAAKEWADGLDRLRLPNVEVVNAAIQEDPVREEVVFRLSPTHPGRSGILPIWANDPTVEYVDVPVAATTIDRICDGQQVDYIKLDLEGGEFRALQGAIKTLTTGRPWVTFENSTRAEKVGGYSQDEFRSFFGFAGYTLLTLWGEDYTPENAFSFWYAAAAPVELRDAVSAALSEAVNRVLYA